MSGMNHDGGAFTLMPTKTVASWPVGTFVENIAVADGGDIFVTVHNASQVLRVVPSTGAVSLFASFPCPVAGLAFDAVGTLWVSGGTPGTAPGSVWRVGHDGVPALWCEIADAIFLNGMTIHPDGRRLLVAESLTSRILAVDMQTRVVSIWLHDPLIGPREMGATPGANGIKFLGDHAYISVTERDLVVRCKVSVDGSAGPVETFAEHLRADDFAVGADGALYIATHPANSLVRLAPDASRTTLAGAEQGLAGATSVAFGRSADDRHCVYITTTGGLFAPIDGVIQPARLVRVETATTAG